MSNILPLRCQRISCDCLLSDTSTKCVHHTQPPQFRDGEKLWPCCNKRSKDFNAFLSIKGCRELDSHSSEKQVLVPPKQTITTSAKEEKDDALGVEKCPRCSNGFACEMHPEESKKNEEKMRRTKELKEQKKREEELERAKMDPNALQTCKRTGCGMKFRESENKNECCRYHKGKPIFHERSKGWSCCASGKKAVYDFDEFLKIPPCAVGRHSAVVEEEGEDD